MKQKMATALLKKTASGSSQLKHKTSIISATSDRCSHMKIHSATSEENMATSRDLIDVNIMYFVIVEYRLMI